MTPDGRVPSSPLGASAAAVLERLLGCGRDLDIELFVVGGAVRDALGGHRTRDLDLVWTGEGDPARVSRELGFWLEAPVAYQPTFLTARLELSGSRRIDLGRARSETYSAPAALPRVQPADLQADLARRDFSVNAMAVPLANYPGWLVADEREAALIDPTGGLADLRAGRLRVLHDRSFRDDPTRLLRGVELRVRRGYRFTEGTRRLAEESVRRGHLELLSGARVRHELERLFRDPRRAVAAARGLAEVGIPEALLEGLEIDTASLERLERLAAGHRDGSGAPSGPAPWLLALTVLAWDQPVNGRLALARRLDLDREHRTWLERVPDRLAVLLRDDATVESEEATMIEHYADLSESERRLLSRLADAERLEFLGRLDRQAELRLGIDGRDLIAAGLPAGPLVGSALAATLRARRAGEISGEAELEFALRWAERKMTDAQD